jgi:hypothetical protein
MGNVLVTIHSKYKTTKGITKFFNISDVQYCLDNIESIIMWRQNIVFMNKGNNKITELRTILQRESENS